MNLFTIVACRAYPQLDFEFYAVFSGKFSKVFTKNLIWLRSGIVIISEVSMLSKVEQQSWRA